MKHLEYFVKRQDSKKSVPVALSVLCVKPDVPPRFIVQILHGISDRKERWLPLMTAIAEAGGMAVIHDLRGHGNTVRSPLELGYYGDFGYHYETLCGDIDAVFASLASDPAGGELLEHISPEMSDCPAIPRYLLGFSMGALMASVYASRRTENLAGVILSGMPHKEALVSLKLFRMHLLAITVGEDAKPKQPERSVQRRFNRNFQPEPHTNRQFLWLSNDPGNRMAFIRDPLCNHRKTVNAYENFLRLLRDTYKPAVWDIPRRELPILVMAGEFDPVAGGDRRVLSGVKFLTDIGFTSVDTLMYRGMRHEIFRDIGRETPFEDVISFCEDHLDAENTRLQAIRDEYHKVFTPADEGEASPSSRNEISE